MADEGRNLVNGHKERALQSQHGPCTRAGYYENLASISMVVIKTALVNKLFFTHIENLLVLQLVLSEQSVLEPAHSLTI